MNNNRHIISSRLSRIILLGVMLLSCMNVNADIVIGGNVYGGGKSGEVGTSRKNATPQTSTEVIVYDGTITQNVFGAGEGVEAVVYGNTDVQIIDGLVGNNLYGGGNAANLLGATNVEISGGTITNAVYGGARKADVNPGELETPDVTIHDYTLEDYSAHVLVTGGIINELYGGNDITGTVKGGGILDIRSDINGNIYGGGNGSYAYTDINTSSEYYYVPGANSITALNTHRPNAERVFIHVGGTPLKKTILFGSLFCGGNSATILHKHKDDSHDEDDDDSDLISLNIGHDVIAENVYLGNNGENMITSDILTQYASNEISSLDLKDESVFASYMDAVNLSITPQITFEEDLNYESFIGSLYLGGNVGSMTFSGTYEIDFDDEVIIYDKLVGGCNSADVAAGTNNAAYKGGILGSSTEQSETVTNGKYKTTYEGQDRLVLNFNGLHLEPRRLVNRALEWNTKAWSTEDENHPILSQAVLEDYTPNTRLGRKPDYDARLDGAIVYGGCYNSGHINGNVVINILDDLIIPEDIFAQLDKFENVTEENSGVDYDAQGEDVLMSSLYVYGAGYGENTEIWGSTTVNMNKGFTFQALGGGEQGTVGRRPGPKSTTGDYYYDPAYSTYINLNGAYAGHDEEDDDENKPIPVAQYLYGGGFEGLVAGNTHMYLGNGRIYDSFGGACNANILGHSETYIGKALAYDSNGKIKKNNSGNYIIETDVFPWIVDNVYGGNDFGGEIKGLADFVDKVRQGATASERNNALSMIYKYDDVTTHTSSVLNASSYVEYYHGRVDTIYGGNYGYYDYYDPIYNKYAYTAVYDEENNIFTTYSTGATDDNLATSRENYTKPYLENAFVNFAPPSTSFDGDAVKYVFGAGMGSVGYELAGDADKDLMQQRSYVLVDIPDGVLTFKDMNVFGSGAYSGLGMFTDADPELGTNYDAGQPTFDPDDYSAIVDLLRGRINEAYGGGYNEGLTRRTVVNVPGNSTVKSTIYLENLFGGGYGHDLTIPCDVYESHVNYSSDDAKAKKVFGGNNNKRRVLYAFMDINSEVWYTKSLTDPWIGSVYGGGKGIGTWSEYTDISLNDGAMVYEVYGGGYGGRVLDLPSLNKWKDNARLYDENNRRVMKTTAGLTEQVTVEVNLDLVNGYEDRGLESNLVRSNGLGTKTNTNIYINRGSQISFPIDNRPSGGNVVIKGGYAYGGGYGVELKDYDQNGNVISREVIPEGGIVSGTTYIGLHGGTVYKDIYAGGSLGGVVDYYRAYDENTVESKIIANAYIEGGSVRNVYGGGWEGDIGYTELKVPYVNSENLSTILAKDHKAQTNVVIGIREDLAKAANPNVELNYYYGIPAIERRAFGGGEGGSVIGTANITVNNGYIGYRYNPAATKPEGYDEAAALKFVPDYHYEEKIDDETHKDGIGTNRLLEDGNVFGGGYDDKSVVTNTNVVMYGGVLRSSLYGGGEIATIGRGSTKKYTGSSSSQEQEQENTGEEEAEENAVYVLDKIYSAGQTKVTLYDGYVLQDVYGAGKGYSNSKEYGHGDVRYHTDGYIFGKTEVYIHGGEIGSDNDVKNKHGNVFGGGNQGYVYSGNGIKSSDGYYHIGGNVSNDLTEDCKVVIEPYAKVLTNTTVGPLTNADDTNSPKETKSFTQNQYIPTAYLNSMKRDLFKNDYKDILDDSGIKIYNGVFAGGNVTSGDEMFANTVTVYGNATATVYDVYNHDYITIGTDHVGGLYGDGNLTRVDGYRELNITNYGTDYYGLDEDEITYEKYRDELTDRERAYFQLRYSLIDSETTESYYCETDGKTYTYSGKEPKTIEELKEFFPDEYFTNGEPKGLGTVWQRAGFCTIYAGRLLNTIQRADFVGIYGSRMVMQGAQDRVTHVVDYTNYTLNRVGEVSLNRKYTRAQNDADVDLVHGNYFGIYNIVNYMGALTSDVDFTEVRKTSTAHMTENSPYAPNSASETYYQWKYAKRNDSERNDGESANKVALASGVYLEITKEPTGNSEQNEKVWGEITGVIELDLINVKAYMGGGYVYAKNEHGTRSAYTSTNVKLLSEYNKGLGVAAEKAISKSGFTYDAAHPVEIQTSGNFVQTLKTVVDDCYPENGKYTGADAAKGHYWYIKGSVYVYDIKVSAYTGAPSEYEKTIKIPLTITAGSSGKLKLIDVKPSLYAYWTTGSNDRTDPSDENKILVGNRYFHLNDTISYWDWKQLSISDQNKFVPETYVATADFSIGNTQYYKGETWLPAAYESLKNEVITGILPPEDRDYAIFSDAVRPSNNMSHDNGYALTLAMTNPKAWNTYYTPEDATDVREGMSSENAHSVTNGIPAPTYNANFTGTQVLGKRYFTSGTIIAKNIVDKHKELGIANHSEGYAVFAPAYILTSDYDPEGWNINNVIPIYNMNGQQVVMSTVDDKTNVAIVPTDQEIQNKYPGISVERALFCTNGWELRKEGLEEQTFNYGTYMSLSQIQALVEQYGYEVSEISDHFTEAYYCVTEGEYGGKKFTGGKNYKAVDAWAALDATDRAKFNFNYDAFDLLIDPYFGGDATTSWIEINNEVQAQNTWRYDGSTQQSSSNLIFAKEQSIDYQAVYEGTDYIYYHENEDGTLTGLSRANEFAMPSGATGYITNGSVVDRVAFESLPNDCKYYAPLRPTKIKYMDGEVEREKYVCYVVETAFRSGEKPYTVGNALEADEYNGLFASQRNNIRIIDEDPDGNPIGSSTRLYYYTGTESGYDDIISGSQYDTYNADNYQKGFSVIGHSPEESATLYVSYDSDLKNLSRGKVFTVMYEYNYLQSNADGTEITPEIERHIVNVHVEFKSGKPIIGNLATPPTILPGTSLSLVKPEVTEGAYHTINGGWELFTTDEDAKKLTNGIEFDKDTKFYWYQDEYWVAYYARNYMGTSYSAPVKISVANYHDLDDVMADKDHHMYVDNPNVKRDSKIYLDNRECVSDNIKSELDLLRDFYDLSLLTQTPTGELEGHALLDSHVKQAEHLEFIINSDIVAKAYSTIWTPIGTTEQTCFKGTVHGDGHTLSGLSASLFGYLCGSVYNLGVTGTFGGTSSGIADHGGEAENCWINTTGTITAGTNAVMGTGVAKNSYYPEEITGYNAPSGVTARPLSAFRNGEVAYNLNGFYLTKRYNDNNGENANLYKYYVADHTHNSIGALTSGYYSNTDDVSYTYSLDNKYKTQNNDVNTLNLGYVESRFIDGDFRYSQGNIPSAENERYYVNAEDINDRYNEGFYPIWPDDYIFFGQKLTYGYELDPEVSTYESKPSAISKEDRYSDEESPKPATFWIVNGDNSNRVFRAPAYYGNSTMGTAHFNQYAVLPAQTATANTPLAQSLQGLDAYPGMTAIDFTAFGTDSWNKGWTGGKFMTPVMDMWLTEPLTGFRTDGQTRNLLVYARDNSENATDVTNLGILNGYLFEPVYDIYANKLDNEGQPTVVANDYQSIHKVAQDTINMVHGHLVVKKTDGKYYAYRDQFLVDLNDFNAPKGYDMDGNLMWYQRTPDVFVKNAGTGWETISLPFTARVVSTSQKGVITHFYSGSNIGHEYWLRTPSSVDETGQTKKVVFQTMAKTAPKADISYSNSFLWDYYYSHENRKDKNEDLYQEYYNYHDKDASAYNDYPLGAAATPYLIGFPSERYYEFDMSGEFEPKNVYGNGPEKLDRQTITFISDQTPGAKVEIGVSDVDYENTSGTPLTGYTFKPTYQTIQVDGPTNYLLNAVDEADPNDENVVATYAGTVFRNEPLPDGFNENTDQRPTLTTVPFRAYFTTQSGSHSDTRRAGTRGDVLYIDYSGDVMPLEDLVADRGLLIYGQDMNICVESTLEYPTEVTIHTVSGKQLKQFTIQPGTKVQIPVYNRGVYIVNHKKIAVTR